jgi:hypothetical protein
MELEDQYPPIEAELWSDFRQESWEDALRK